MPCATPGSAASARIWPAPTPTCTAASSCCAPYDDPDASVAEVLLDQRVFCGVGNVFRCEVLWAGQLSPFAKVADLPAGRRRAPRERRRQAAAGQPRRRPPLTTSPAPAGGRAVYGRNGQRCQRCGDTVASRRSGEHGRVLYWCPGCQVRFDPRRSRLDDTQWLDEPKTDRHPAARKFLADPPWRRTG